MSVEIKSYFVLPDQGYTIDRIAANTTLHFEENGYLDSGMKDIYWIKIKNQNPFQYAEKGNIWLFGNIKDITR